jgi:hypothetical protein
VDDAAIGRAAMRYLLEKGRRRLAFLSSPPSLPTHIHLLRGIRQELSDAGVELLPEHMGLTGYDQSRAFAILDSWLARRSHRPSAVFTADDSLLLQMYDYVESRQLSVPGDISIVARANSPNAGGLRPVPRRFTFPTDPLQPIGAAFGPLGFLGEAVGYRDPTRWKTPMSEQYTLSLVRQIPYDIVLQVTYVGNHGPSSRSTVQHQSVEPLLLQSWQSRTAGSCRESLR